MKITVNGNLATEIDNSVVEHILKLYPEENLHDRRIFQDAFARDSIEYEDLKEESEKILIPWQMFFLNPTNLQRELRHIENQRTNKVSSKLVAKRRGSGDVTSRRIIDRLIRLQNFITATLHPLANTYCSSLTHLSDADAVNRILTHFSIDIDKFRSYQGKGSALEYLIGTIEQRGVNISRGVLAHKILPHWSVVSSQIYKNTSGFVIKDECIPFIFLPSEINPDEVEGRQIYTLVYLLVVIGLGSYNFFLEKDFSAKAITATGKLARIHRITAMLLLPVAETTKLLGQTITASIRDALASKYKMTPRAVVVTLRIRGVIKSQREYDALLPPPFKPTKGSTEVGPRSPHVKTSVRKFCGKYGFDSLNLGMKNATLESTQAQHLIFGAPNKKTYKKLRGELGI